MSTVEITQAFKENTELFRLLGAQVEESYKEGFPQAIQKLLQVR